MFPAISKKQLSEGEIIPYAIASQRPDKTGGFIIFTPVSWENVEVLREKITLATIGEVEVIKKPLLPKGYQMVTHPEVLELLVSIYDGRKNYTPEYVHKAFADVVFLVKKGFVNGEVFDYVSIGDISFLADDSNPNICNYFNWCDRERTPSQV